MYYKINICICADRQNLVNPLRNFFFERLKQSIGFMDVLIHLIAVGYRRNAQDWGYDVGDTVRIFRQIPHMDQVPDRENCIR